MRFLTGLIFILLCSKSFALKGSAEYSEATDVFEIMDHVSMWHGSLSRSYINEWQKRFPLNLKDKGILAEYKKIRLKHHKVVVSEGTDVFGKMPIGYDRLSKAFYSSKSIGEALKKLEKKKIDKEDIKFLKKFYKHFKDRITLFVKESSQFQVKVLGLNQKWKNEKAHSYMKKFVKFVLGKKGRKIKTIMRPVWYPQGEKSRVDLRGPYLIIRIHPLETMSRWDIDLYLEKSVESIIHGQPINQRTNLSKIFRQRCRGREDELQQSLKIVFAKMLPKSMNEKKKFELYNKWDKRTFINVYSKLLFPLASAEMKGKDKFSGKFMLQASKLCREVHDLAFIP